MEAEHFIDVTKHFENYQNHSWQKFKKMQADFNRIDPRLSVLVPGLTAKLENVKKRLVHNQAFIEAILSQRGVFQSETVNYDLIENRINFYPNEERQSKVRSTIRQCLRDWSSDGLAERNQCYKPLLDELERLYPIKSSRHSIKVLVPGAGLARLVWEAAHKGFFSQGNEFSYFMLLTSYYILNCIKKPQTQELFPFVWETKNLLKTEHQMKSILIPDVNPSSLPKNSQFSMVAGDFMEVYGTEEHASSWDVVLSCFFLDTANNILEYLRVVSYILKPGGHLINFGPLLYHYADMDNELSIELSYEELKPTFSAFGLKLLKEQSDLPCTYTGNFNSMMQQEYRCVSFTLVKEKNLPLQIPPNPPIPILHPNNSSQQQTNHQHGKKFPTLNVHIAHSKIKKKDTNHTHDEMSDGL